MLMERFQHQRLQIIHKISSQKAFINSTNNIAIKTKANDCIVVQNQQMTLDHLFFRDFHLCSY
ncbi:hypothetical protein BCV23_12315 [Vibrio lentus]|uniref:Uncharacterized protein n=1 Tax=Vibrio lentus TaxID=136468 RepID=A0AA45A8J9_9VIBR|nr:hypothetical protein BCV23_12315 [Vibrio lentus]PMF71969.1 hypothetical protein BCV10_21220 [Vibrio lentus]